MALGVELNSIAPNLIRDSGQALVQGIRQIGQQISGHLTEIQTKRDMAAMAQELQGLNVQSNEFTPQLAQVISRHPMAARDERGQLALSILGKAHGQWQAGEAEARAFNRAMAMQTARDRSAREMFDYKREKELGDPQNIGGSLVIPKDPVTGQPNILIPAPARSGGLPFASSPQGIYDRRTGQVTAPALPKKGGMTAFQNFQAKRAAIEARVKALSHDIARGEAEYKKLEAAEADAIKSELEDEYKKINSVKTTTGTAVDGLKADRQKLLKEIEMLAAETEEEETAGVLPAPGEITTEIRVSKDGKRYEVDPVSKKVLRQLP